MKPLATTTHPDRELVLPAPGRRSTDYKPPFGEGSLISGKPVFRLDIANSVRRSPKLFVGVAVAMLILLIAAAMSIKPAYDAEALVYVEPLPGKLLGEVNGFYDPSRYASSMQQQIQTATRQDTLEEAVESLGNWRAPGESLAHAANRLAAAVSIKRVGESFQMSISASGPNAKQTADIVNAVTNAFLSQGRKDSNANTEERLKLLGEERSKIQADLEAAHNEQAQLSTDLGVAVSNGTSSANPYDVELSGTRAELIAAEQAHDMAVAQFAAIRDKNGNPSAGLTAQAQEAAAGDSGLAALKASVSSRRAQLNGLMAGMTPENKLYRSYQNELNQLDAQVQSRTTALERAAEQRLLAKDELEVRRTGEIEGRLRAQVAQGTHAAGNAAPKLQRSAELTADITRLETRYATVDDAMRGLTLEATGPGVAHLSVPATVPAAPAASKRKVLLLLALPLSLAMGVAAALIAAFMNRRVVTAVDLERVLGFPPMAVLPARGEISAEALDECLLRLAGSLERAHRSAGARSFAFAPLSAGTSIAELTQALERKLALLGFSVLLFDAEHLLRGSGADDAQNAADRLANWTQHSDFVLFGAQPLLQSAEAEYAVSNVDATVLVVESGVATKREVTRALSLLRRLHVLSVGVILENLSLRLAGEDLRTAVSHIESRAALPAEIATPSPTPVAALHEGPSDAGVAGYDEKAQPEVDSTLPIADAEPVVRFETQPAVDSVVVQPVPSPVLAPPAEESVVSSRGSANEADVIVLPEEPDAKTASGPTGALVAEDAPAELPFAASKAEQQQEPIAQPVTDAESAVVAEAGPTEVAAEAQPEQVAGSAMPPQRFVDLDPMLPAWLAEALQPASAAATPFVSTPPAPRMDGAPAAVPPAQVKPEAVAAPESVIYPEPVRVADPELRPSLIAWGAQGKGIGSRPPVAETQSNEPSVTAPFIAPQPVATPDAWRHEIASPARGVSASDAFMAAVPAETDVTLAETTAPAASPVLTHSHADRELPEPTKPAVWTGFNGTVPLFVDEPDFDTESVDAAAAQPHSGHLSQDGHEVVAPAVVKEQEATVADPFAPPLVAEAPVESEPKPEIADAVPMAAPIQAETALLEAPVLEASPLKPEPQHRFDPLPSVEAPTLIYERPVFSSPRPASAPMPMREPLAPAQRPAARSEYDAASSPVRLPQPAASEAIRPRETGRVVSWTPKPARMRPGLAPGQSGIYGPGTVPGAAPRGVRRTDPTGQIPYAAGSGEETTVDLQESRRWHLLRRFDPRSRMFSPRLNEVAVPENFEAEHAEYDQIAERNMRNGSGK